MAVLAAIALFTTYVLLRGFIPVPQALLGVAMVGFFPGFGLLATSFMGDVPTYLAIVLTLLAGERAVRQRSFRWLAVAAVAGVWGFLTREQAVAALAAILVSAFVSWQGTGLRRRLLLFTAAIGIFLVVAELWRQGLAHDQQPTLQIDGSAAAITAVKAYFTLGLLLLPATLLVVKPLRWSLLWKGVALAVAVGGALFLHRYKTLLLGNYLEQHGAYSSVLLGSRTVLPPWLWDLIQVGAWTGGVLMTGEVLFRLARLELYLLLFAGFTLLGTAFEIVVGEATFDRFLLPLIPVGVIVLLRDLPAGRRQINRALAASALGALAVISLLITANGLAFDSARWSHAQAMVSSGTNPRSIDAGLEWVGFHSPVAAVDAAAGPGRRSLPWYAQQLYPQAPECFVFSSSPAPGLGRLIRIIDYRTFLVWGRSQLFVYDTQRCRTDPS